MKKANILITGSNGLVGHALCLLLQDEFIVLKPSHLELNILDKQAVNKYFDVHKVDCVIHAAAYVNAGKAEDERGNDRGLTYQTNVEGTKNIVHTAKNFEAKSIYISTGSVFHGQENNPGPFSETDLPVQNPDQNSWYGYTKYLGEKTGPDTIIRISHPIIPSQFRIKDDYLQKIIHAYEEKNLFPLFPDQLFPLTSIYDLAQTLKVIISLDLRGVFHVVSDNLVSPLEMTKYVLQILNKPIDVSIKTLSIEEFYKLGNSKLRFAKYSAISGINSERILGIKFRLWEKIVLDGVT